jgi:hypothetical protein
MLPFYLLWLLEEIAFVVRMSSLVLLRTNVLTLQKTRLAGTRICVVMLRKVFAREIEEERREIERETFNSHGAGDSFLLFSKWTP